MHICVYIYVYLYIYTHVFNSNLSNSNSLAASGRRRLAPHRRRGAAEMSSINLGAVLCPIVEGCPFSLA